MSIIHDTYEINVCLDKRSIEFENNRVINLYNTDENILSFVLYIYKNNNILIPKSKLNDICCELTVVKPSTEIKEIAGVFNDNIHAHVFDLNTTFFNQVGVYKCELRISNANEVLTCNYFTYTVKGSIITNLDNTINEEELSVLTGLITEVRAMQHEYTGIDDTTTSTNQTWSSQKISTEIINAKGNTIDLSDYYNKQEVDELTEKEVFKTTFDIVDNVATCDKTKNEIVQAITDNKVMLFEYHKKLHSYYVVNETGTNVQVVFSDVSQTKNTLVMFQVTSMNVYTRTVEIPLLQVDDTSTSADKTWSSEKISSQLHSIVQRLIALEGGTVVTPDPPTPTETIVGTVGTDNTITLTNLENGTYTLRYEDDNGILNGYDNIATVEVV